MATQKNKGRDFPLSPTPEPSDSTRMAAIGMVKDPSKPGLYKKDSNKRMADIGMVKDPKNPGLYIKDPNKGKIGKK